MGCRKRGTGYVDISIKFKEWSRLAIFLRAVTGFGGTRLALFAHCSNAGENTMVHGLIGEAPSANTDYSYLNATIGSTMAGSVRFRRRATWSSTIRRIRSPGVAPSR